MARTTATPSSLASRSGWMPHWLFGNTTLSLLLGGLLSSLLVFTGTLLIGEEPSSGEPLPSTCLAFWVGSPHPASTYIHLENIGPEHATVQFEFIDGDGLPPLIDRASRSLAPGASDDLEFRLSATLTFVELNSLGNTIRADVATIPDYGPIPGSREASPCGTQRG